MWKKVITPVVFIVSIWAVLSVTTNYYINWLYKSSSQVLREDMSSIQAAGAMQDSLWRLQSAAMNAIDNSSENAWKRVGEWESLFEKSLSEVRQAASTEEEKRITGAIRDGIEKYVEHVRSLKKRIDNGGAVPLHDIQRLTLLARDTAGSCNEWFEHNRSSLTDAMTEGNRLIASYYRFRLVYLIAGSSIGILFGFWVANGLHRSVSQIGVVLQNASSELEQEVGHVEILAADDLTGVHRQLGVVSGHITKVLEELQKTRRDVIRSERLAAVGELAAGVAHEIRNPLTSIKLLIQTEARRQSARPMDSKELQIIQEEIARMERTIQGLLDFARPPALRHGRLDLRDIVERTIELVEGRAHQQNVSIIEELPKHPLWIDGDPEQLHQVFVNLLLNGIDSMPQGGTLHVAVEEPSEDDICRLSISDSGGGIPQDILERLFEPFVTSKDRGTGLGLAVSRRIVQEHRGALKVANRSEKGAVFTVELPLEAEQTGPMISVNGHTF
jgi:two-component system, NtrC family, sensor histidine kinase HydH